MNKVNPTALVLLLLLVHGGCGIDTPKAGGDSGDGRITLSVVGTNDVHGNIVERNGAGGLALFGGYVANLRSVRADDGGAVLLIDAGDMWQGTLESNMAEGAPVVAAYNALQYDAAAIGNHEFDFGPQGPAVVAAQEGDDPRGALKARAAEAKFPFLAANLIDATTDAPVAWPNVRPTSKIDVAGITAGIIGVTSRDTPASTLAAHVKGLRVTALAETIRAQAEALRADGAQLIIVTAHAGGRCDRYDDPADLSSCEADSEIFEVARALPHGLVDLIVAGHVHKGLAHEVNGIAIISSWSGGEFFGRVDFRIDNGHVAARRIFPPQRICRYVEPSSGQCRGSAGPDGAVAAMYEGAVVRPDTAIARVIAPAIAEAGKLKAEKLGPHLETAIRRRPVPESPIGNLLTDILLASDPRADVAIHNTLGGIRADLPAGDLTFGSVYEMFPFDNRIMHLEISGAELKSVLANQVEGPLRRGHVSGVRVIADCADEELSLRVFDTDGREVRDEERLLVVTNDFLVTGGDSVLTPIMPAEGFAIDYEGPLVRDVIVEWMRANATNLNEEQFNSEANPRWDLPQPAPLTCDLSAQ